MKSRILMATAAVGLVISGVAIAANSPAAGPAAANLNSSMQPAAPAAMASTTTTTTTQTLTVPSGKTVLDLADSNSEFSTLAKAIKAAGLEQTLSAKGPLTVFAPTNAAFAKLGPAKLNDLLKPENKAELTQILTYHVVPQTVPASTTTASLTTAEGQSLSVTHAATGYQVQNAKSEGAPISASNGSIIAIDSVLMPEAQAKMALTPSDPNAALPSVAGTTTVKTTTTTTAPVPPTPPSAMAPTAPLSAPPAITK
jgi:uncharacterized surface protein with fasciclin (FAS1) repeats